jgi:hypothetical protein
LNKVPDGVVSGTALIDFSATPNVVVRSSVSLAMLFASRVANAATSAETDPDSWLANYTSAIGQIGFTVAGTALVHSTFKKIGLQVHQAIIPFLTVAFGGVTIGPIILAGLKNLQQQDAESPWIALFDRETRRFDAREMHFAAVSSDDTTTTVKYAIARLNVKSATTLILFFKLTQAEAQFESSTTTMNANNSLLAAIEGDLRTRLGDKARSFITEAKLDRS